VTAPTPGRTAGRSGPGLSGGDGGDGGRPTASSVWGPRGGVHGVELDGEWVLYDERTRRLHLLNPSAGVIWACLDGDVPLGELIDELAEVFGVDRLQMGEDVAAALTTMAAEGLVIRCRHPDR